MKVAVINFSGNVGKSTIAQNLLEPRIPNAKLVRVESINSDEGQTDAIRGKQFGELQEYLQTVDDVVVDIGASNVEDFLSLMKKFHGSHEDFDYFVVPTVPANKQQKDTIATLVELSRLGIPARKMKLLFNMVEDGSDVVSVFSLVFDFVAEHPIAEADARRTLSVNEVYQRAKQGASDIRGLAEDKVDYKAAISKATDQDEKLALAGKLATKRLAVGVLPELDACFNTLGLK